MIYEIEFFKNNVEYEYDIDAATGTVLDYDTDYDDATEHDDSSDYDDEHDDDEHDDDD